MSSNSSISCRKDLSTLGRTFCVVIVAGEASGDKLGAALIHSIKKRHPKTHFIGIGGPKMLALNFTTLFPMERLSVFGISDVLWRLPELLKIRSSLYTAIIKDIKPDIFIGIDAPDFTISLAAMLHKKGIKTLHYVSPTVWAWRPKRVFKIKAAIDHMLTLFPFEEEFYKQHDVPVTFVGHPIADEIDIKPDKEAARAKLGIANHTYVIALLPGSRHGEVNRLLPTMLQTTLYLKKLLSKEEKVIFVIPSANQDRHQQIKEIISKHKNVAVNLYGGMSKEVLIASDQVLVTSGTATLETMLAKKMMVVVYKESWLTWLIAKSMLKIRWISLPNLLAGKLLVPEFLQNRATPSRIAEALYKQMQDDNYRTALMSYFEHFHTLLKRNASERAAEVVDFYLTKNVLEKPASDENLSPI